MRWVYAMRRGLLRTSRQSRYKPYKRAALFIRHALGANIQRYSPHGHQTGDLRAALAGAAVESHTEGAQAPSLLPSGNKKAAHWGGWGDCLRPFMLCSARPRRAALSAARTANGRFGRDGPAGPCPSNLTREARRRLARFRQEIKKPPLGGIFISWRKR